MMRSVSSIFGKPLNLKSKRLLNEPGYTPTHWNSNRKSFSISGFAGLCRKRLRRNNVKGIRNMEGVQLSGELIIPNVKQ
jgi:hypothetical protein